jgi:hypothetical protein
MGVETWKGKKFSFFFPFKLASNVGMYSIFVLTLQIFILSKCTCMGWSEHIVDLRNYVVNYSPNPKEHHKLMDRH